VAHPPASEFRHFPDKESVIVQRIDADAVERKHITLCSELARCLLQGCAMGTVLLQASQKRQGPPATAAAAPPPEARRPSAGGACCCDGSLDEWGGEYAWLCTGCMARWEEAACYA